MHAALQRAALERAVSCAATLLAYAVKEHRRCALLLPERKPQQVDGGRSLMPALESLAAVRESNTPAEQALRDARLGRGASALLLSLLNAFSRGSEDYPGAVRQILAEHKPGDAVVSVEWQPAFFPQGRPWDWYAPRLAAGEPPTRLAMKAFTVQDHRDLERYPRYFVLRTSLPGEQHLLATLRERFGVPRATNYGFGVDVLVFE